MRKAAFPLWLAPLLLLAVAQAASAQLPVQPPATGTADVKISMEIKDPGQAMVPSRPYAMKVTVHYQYGGGGNNMGGSDPCADLTVVEPPPWALIEIKPSHICFPINPTFAVSGTTVSNSTFVTMNLTDDAPALAPYDLTISAHAPAIGPFKEATGQGTRAVQAGFVGRLELQAPHDVVIRGGSPQPLALTFVNRGNGPMTVRFKNVTAPQGLRVELPPSFVLDKPGDQRTVNVVLMAPWSAQVRGLLDIGTEAVHPSRTDLTGDTPHAKLNIDAKAAVPGFEPLLFAAAAVGAASLARRPSSLARRVAAPVGGPTSASVRLRGSRRSTRR